MKYWLMKAEPNSRIEKGKDVKFSVDDFESVKTTAWEGVRNHEAKKLMQSMKVGDQVLFYHSNCRNPGVAGFAEISKEAYPDYTAWDPDHPYYDAKSKKDEPRWFMVDVSFKSRATHLVPLHQLKRIASTSTSTDEPPPEEVAYIGEEGVLAIKEMALIKRGRLSVQPVEEDAWKAVQLLAENGGWKEEDLPASTKGAAKSKASANPKKWAKRTRSKNMKSDPERDASESKKGMSKGQSRGRTSTSNSHKKAIPAQKRGELDEGGDETERHAKKRKGEAVDGTEDDSEASALRRSTRRKR